MLVNELKPKHKLKSRKIVGRGGKKGTYSGRGGKGQTARSGRKLAPIVRELIKRYPKLKGYRAFRVEHNIAIINLDVLEKHVKDGEVITPTSLVEKKLVHRVKGKIPKVKILGRGALSKKIVIEGCKVSESVKKAVEKAGGSIKL